MATAPLFLNYDVSDTAMVVLVVAIGLVLTSALLFVVVALGFRARNRRKAERWGRLEAKWEPLILDVLAGSRPGRELSRRVEKGEELYFVDFLYRYARRLRGSEAQIIAELSRPFVHPIVQGVRHGDAERRARAVQTLSVLDFPTHASVIREALDDPSPLVSMIAARSLARPDQAEHADAVLSRVPKFGSWSPRFLSSMLAAMGPDAAPRIRAALADRTADPQLRTVAADALRKLGDIGAGDTAVDVLRGETDQDLLSAALRLLRKVGRPEHLSVVRGLTESPDPVVRAQAICTLGGLGSAQDVESLRTAMDDASPWVAIHGAQGLREIGRGDLLREIGSSSHTHAAVARQVLAERA